MTVIERKPVLFDFFAGAILTNGLSTMALYLAAYEPFFILLLIPLWCLAAAVSSYLVCKRTSRDHLIVGVKTALISIALGVITIPTFQTLDLGQIIVTLACFLVGSIGGAYVALRDQLKRGKSTVNTPQDVEP